MKADILSIYIMFFYASAVQFCKQLVTNCNSDLNLITLLLLLIR